MVEAEINIIKKGIPKNGLEFQQIKSLGFSDRKISELTNIDIKETGNVTGLWNTHRADMQRSGYYLSTVNALSVGDDIENYEFRIGNKFLNNLSLPAAIII